MTITVDINNGGRALSAPAGTTLLKALAGERIFLPSACGGRGVCGYCKVKIENAPPNVTPSEALALTDAERAAGIRLACQTSLQNNISIRIPPALLNVKGLACICADIRPLTPDIRSFRLRLPARDALPFVPGQYIQLRVPPTAERPSEVYRAYSIASDPADTAAIELIIRLAPGGISTTYCFNVLKKGDVAQINGPHGDFTLRDTDKPVIFIAGGSGFAPIKAMLHHMKNTGSRRPARFFFGARDAGDLFYLNLMREFEQSIPDFRFIPAIARPGEAPPEWSGRPLEQGLVTDAISRHITDAAGHEAYLCGGPGMIDAAIKTLAGLGMPDDAIFYDKFI